MKETFDRCDRKVFILGLTEVVDWQFFGITVIKIVKLNQVDSGMNKYSHVIFELRPKLH